MLPFNPFSGLTAKVYGGVALLAIAVAGVQTVRIDGLWFIKGYVERLDRSEARNEKLIAASEAARIAQIAMNEKRKQDEKDNAHETDKNDRIAQLEARQPAIDYRDRWRLRNVCEGIAASPDSTASDPVAENSNRSSDVANMVAISSADFDQCTANSIRLQSVKRWGDALIEKGLAVPVE
jgi:hypothetical protein